MSSVVAWRTFEGGTVEGKFPLRRWLGASDQSAVFLTVRQGEMAAIKLIAAEGAPDYLSRWRAAAQLSHLHLIRIFETGRCQLEGEKFLYVVMEFAEEDLSQIIPQRALTTSEAGDMLPPLLDALSYLHGMGFLHAHIRPSNVLAVGDLLKLTSDQVMPASDAAAEHRRRDVYDAPETAAGVISPASDVWSVGATLVAALTQGSGLPGEIPQGDPKLPATIPEPFRGIARECLHLDPRRRSSIAEIMARLQPAGRSVPAEPEPLLAAARRSSRAPITIAVLVVALVVGLIAFFSRGKSVPPQSSGSADQSAQTSQAPSTAAPTTIAPSAAAPSTASKSVQKPPASVSAAPTPVAPTRPTPTQPAKTAPPRTPKPVASQGEIVHRAIPDVPKSARNTITGKIKVSVQVDVDASGKVKTAKLTSAGPSQYFARVALNAAQQWEFAPAASTWALHFRFGRKGTEVSPEKVSR